MTHAHSEKVAGQVLAKIEVLFPKFSIPKEPDRLKVVVNAWSHALSKYRYPDEVWLEAVDEYFSQPGLGGEPPYPGDVLNAAKRVIERVERDPVRGPKLRAWREKRQEERDEALRRQNQALATR